jgi:hypothetical protein
MQSLTRAGRYSVLCDMNDTVRAMRSCGLLLLVACGSDPSLAISVHHPAVYDVKQTLVTVYAGNDVSCSQIQFGDYTQAELAALAVTEVDVSSGAHVEVSRLGGKSFVARGYDAQHRFVTAGCADKGEIVEGTEVQIDTGPAAVVAIDPAQPDRPFSERTILVNMADANGEPIDGKVSWQLIGPAGVSEPPATDGIQTRNGNVRIEVDDLGMPGPEALRIRVPWAIAPLPLVTAFDLSGATTIPLVGGNLGGNPSCDLRGHSGEPPTLVCLSPASGLGQHRDVIEIAWQTNRYVATPIAIPPALNNQFALFVDRTGDIDEPVYIISADAAGDGRWYKLGDPAGAAKQIAFGGPLQNIVYIPRCRDFSAGALVAVQTRASIIDTPDRLAFFTPAGTEVRMSVDGEVLSGGCVGDVDKKEHQAVVVTAGGDAVAGLVLINSATQMQTVPGTRLTGSGFIAVESGGMIEKRFAGTRLQASGTVVFEAVLAPEAPGVFKLVERLELDTAGPPTKIVGGKLDHDPDTDLMWDINAGLRRRIFQVSLAKREHISGLPLTAMTSGPPATTSVNAAAADFLVGDLDDGSTDEMILFTAGAVTIFSAD